MPVNIRLLSMEPCVKMCCFGQPFNQQRYDKAINAAELVLDLENMPNGDSTEVATKGAALSGGQKARLTLARCFFSNRDVYLLDDVLSSTNKEVADSIFNKSIKNLLANKTVLLVTSNPEYLAQCDKVVFLANGAIHATGLHADLLQNDPTYKEFFETTNQGNFILKQHD